METKLPTEYKNVWITYKTIVHVPDKYYGHDEKQIVRRRAFYSKSNGYYDSKDNWVDTPNGYYSVPQYWQTFTFSDGNSALLPHTFYSYGRVFPDDIIKWEYDENKLKQYLDERNNN